MLYWNREKKWFTQKLCRATAFNHLSDAHCDENNYEQLINF